MKNKQNITKLTAFVLAVSLMLAAAGCGVLSTRDASTLALETAPSELATVTTIPSAETLAEIGSDIAVVESPSVFEPFVLPAETTTLEPPTEAPEPAMRERPSVAFQYADVPAYRDEPYVVVNANVPYFAQDQITAAGTERYSPLDSLGRCGPAWASVGLELMPQNGRGDISSVTPTGWNQAKVDGDWLYNRCHLIGYQLTAEDARPQNLVTGTRYLNIQGMLPFENMVADYVKETSGHVMYRATPVFEGNELLCRGVLLEGLSVEDGGVDVCFCVFAYNVQPGVELSYADGAILSSTLPVADGNTEAVEQPTETLEPEQKSTDVLASSNYTANENTGKFHRSECSSVDEMEESNKVPFATAAEALAEGYVPCKRCRP